MADCQNLEVLELNEHETFPINDELCGCDIVCCCKSKTYTCGHLQTLANAKSALLLFSLAHMSLQTVHSGLLSVCISTLEKRFELQSVESGLIASSLDIASVCALVFISFMGEGVHKPSWIGWGLFISGIGSLLFTLPHFIAPTYTYVETEAYNVCGNVTESKCSQTSLRDYRYVFILAMGIVGIGQNPIFIHGITYLDENVKKDLSSLYNSIFYAMGGIGPAIGFLCGGAALELYTNTSTNVDEIGIDSSSYLWVGAWWLGFLICGVLLILNALPIFLLPGHLPGTEKHRMNRNIEVQKHMLTKEETNQEESTSSNSITDILLLCKNKPYIFLTLGCTLNSALVYGFNTFGVKYVEMLFNLTGFHAAVLYGIAAIFASAGGHIIGGVIVSRFRLSVQQMQKLMGLFSAICSFGFFVHCPDLDFAGGTVPYYNDTSMETSARCNVECGCSTDRYDPVCGEDDVTYFSPCYAGCTVQLNEMRAFIIGLGVVPGRILTGTVLDFACVSWSTECGHQGSCRAYRKWDMARNTAILLLAQTITVLIFYILVFVTYEPDARGKEEKSDGKISACNQVLDIEKTDEDTVTERKLIRA